MTYLIEYLGELEFIFETVLGYVSGDQMGYVEAKKTESKISCLGTFKSNDHGSQVLKGQSHKFELDHAIGILENRDLLDFVFMNLLITMRMVLRFWITSWYFIVNKGLQAAFC